MKIGRRELVIVDTGIETVNVPVLSDRPGHFFVVATIALHYDARLGIRWGAYENTTFYSAVK